MPNYGLVVTPTYNPMSYEQYIQPFKDYAQVYNATVDQIDALEMEANQWERLADSDIDAPQYQQYKSYADDLRKYANEIATQGLSSRTRAGLSRMRQRYSKEIKPIEDAFNRRQEAIKAEDALLAKDPSLVLAGSARNIGLGQYMAGTPQVYGVSGNDVYARTLAATKAITDAMALDTEEKNAFRGFYYDFVTRVGEPNAEAAYNYIRSKGVDDNKAVQFSKYVDAINDVLSSTNYNLLSDEGKNRIYNYAVNGAITGIGYDEKHQLLRSPYYDAYLKSLDRPDDKPQSPATSSVVIRGQVGEPKDAVKVRQSLNEARGRVMNPWEWKDVTDNTFGRFSKDSPIKRSFNSPLEVENWITSTKSIIDDYIKAQYDKDKKYSPDSSVKQYDIDGVKLSYSELDKLNRDIEKLQKRVSDYKELVDPYFKTLQIDDNGFATDLQLAQIAQIQQNASVRQLYTKELDSLDPTDKESKKKKYDQIINGVRDVAKNSDTGLWKIDKKTGKLEKVTDMTDYNKIAEKGNLIYASEYGIVVRDENDGSIYMPKGDSQFDSFNNSHKAILQALNFDDSLYTLKTNQIHDFTGELGNLSLEDNTYNPNTAVYEDRNIIIFEGLDPYGNTRRDVIDKLNKKLITSITLTEATNRDGYLAHGDFQTGINEWMKQALNLITVPNSNI